MTNRAPSQLDFPPTVLHKPTYREPHVDSEESVQYERQRVPQELGPITHHEALRHSSEASAISNGNLHNTTIASQNTPSLNLTASQSRLRHHASTASTQSDQNPSSPNTSTTPPKPPNWFTPITTFWTTHITLTIDEGAHRDHLALERTFLGYLRTSLVLVMTGVLTAQVFRLQHSSNPHPHFGFYAIGRPLSITFISMAILVLGLGAVRFWRLQRGLVRGRAYAGGWEVMLIMGLSVLLLGGTFALVLGVNIEKAVSGGRVGS